MTGAYPQKRRRDGDSGADGDITRLAVDAIVNAANTPPAGAGWMARFIGRRGRNCWRSVAGWAGAQGRRKSRGYRLPAKWVIYTPGPVYRDGRHGSRSCWRAVTGSRRGWRWSMGHGCCFPRLARGVWASEGGGGGIAAGTVRRGCGGWRMRRFAVFRLRIANIERVLGVEPEAGV